ncbi:MAG: EthD family reductase [Acidobacteriota bacterium]
MAGAKFIVIYPRPTDVEAFEKLYQDEHVPMAVEKLAGKTKFVATKVVGSPQGEPPFYRVAEIHFPSLKALETCAASEGARETLAHAVSISSGGTPIFMIAEEEVFTFDVSHEDTLTDYHKPEA